jgi:hypothetical protein
MSEIQIIVQKIGALLQSVTEYPGTVYDEYENLKHLKWMITTIEQADDMPEDKIGRWIGSVCGILKCKYGLSQTSLSAITEDIIDGRRTSWDHPLMKASAEIVGGLQDRVKNSKLDPNALIELENLFHFFEAKQENSVLIASFNVGKIQSLLKCNKLLDFDEERNRTRPIMHAAYQEMGLKPPKTRERTGD